MISYLIIEGDGSTNYSAYCPDLPGVVAPGRAGRDSPDLEPADILAALEYAAAAVQEREPPSSSASVLNA
jgi:hypothetical protein